METVLIRLHFNLRPRNIIMVARWHTLTVCVPKIEDVMLLDMIQIHSSP